MAIEDLFEQLCVGAEFATEGGDTPFTPQMINLGYSIIFKTGLFNTACYKWRDTPAADKIFANLKTHLKNGTKIALLEMSGGTHHVPRASVATTAHVRTKLAQICQKIQALTSALASSSNPMSNNAFLAASTSSSTTTITPTTLTPVGLSYCWTHRSSHNHCHTCHNKSEGRQDSATEASKQGGSGRI
jgi:hypothetical protein